MKVELVRKNNFFHFEAFGSSPVSVHMDGSPDIGGENAGSRPMELLLMGLAGCTAIDLMLILKKQKQQVEDVRITVEGEREVGVTPSVFKKIHLHFIFKGLLEEEKVKRALNLSLNKYCSVNAMLNKTANVSSSFEIIS